MSGWFMSGLTPLYAAQQRDNFTTLYGMLLERYWHPATVIHGIETTVFDYRRMAADAGQPDSLVSRILDTLRKVDPETVQSGDVAKAFWINVYNFSAMHLVLQHYPVDSIRSLKISLIKYPWSKKIIEVGNRRYTLGEIEKEVLLKKFGDARIVFAVSCAAVSCPDQGGEPFTARNLDAQLDDLVRRFLRNPKKGLRLDRQAGVLTLSMIFKKEARLFTAGYGGAVGFIRPYLDRDTAQWLESHPFRIEYFRHDWTLNDICLEDKGATCR
jgi:hypothetical protein